MENCLVTKLKGQVTDTNLEKLGVLLYPSLDLEESSSAATGIGIASDGVHSVSLIANGTTLLANYTSSTANYANVGTSIGFINGIKLEFTNMYYVTRIISSRMYRTGSWLDDDYLVSRLKWMTKLVQFDPVTNTNLVLWPLMDVYAGMYECGRREGEMTTLCKVKINNATIQSPTAVFSTNDVKVYNTDKSTLLATYDGSDWTYA